MRKVFFAIDGMTTAMVTVEDSMLSFEMALLALLHGYMPACANMVERACARRVSSWLSYGLDLETAGRQLRVFAEQEGDEENAIEAARESGRRLVTVKMTAVEREAS